MNTRLWAVAWKEFVQLRRDRMTLGMMVGIPVIQLLLFGYAINTDVRHSRTVVYDQDRSSHSRELTQALQSTGFYDLVGEVRDYDEIERAFRGGQARVAFVIPPRFGSNLMVGRPARVQLVVDGSDPQTVASATNTAASLIAARSATMLLTRIAASGVNATVPFEVETTTWYNADLRTATYIVPGLVGVILTMTMVMLTAMAIARERERGTLEQLIVSPVRRIELTVGKILPYVLIGYVQMTLVLIIGRLVFGVPIVGSIALLYGMAFVFITASLGIGLLFSTIARTQQQAMQMSFFFFLPNVLLSGFMFPWEAMPRLPQILAQALPLTHFLRIVRGITLKGAGFHDVSHELVWLVCILVILLTAASLRVRKKLG